MKVWKLLPPERKKQLFIVLIWRLCVFFVIMLLGLGILVEVTIRQYFVVGLFSILILIFVQSNIETITNFKKIIKDLEQIENMEE